jgi:hypothetical protein
VGLCVCVLAGTAHPAGFVYSGERKPVKAGVLLMPGQKTAPDPYVFWVMDQRMDLKPAGWEFSNPQAPSRVTSEINGLNRWNGAYASDQIITKDMGCYWEIKAGAPFEALAEFDVLFLGSNQTMNFSRENREKLRKFVDAGGVLWIDNCDMATFNTSNMRFFIADLQFSAAGGGAPALAPNPAHPLVARPFALTWEEATSLGLRGLDGRHCVDFGSEGARYFSSVITGRDARPVLAGAQYGSGHIVVSALSVGDAISNPVDNAAYADENKFMAAQPEDLKLAFNIVNWGAEHTTFHKNARHTGYSFETLGFPKGTMWEFYEPPGGITGSSPAILDDMVFYVDGAGILHAFDLSPARDRDLDGSSDDGWPDRALGAPYDELWRVPLGEPGSSPTAAYVPMGGIAVPLVFVTLQSGKVVGFNAALYTPTTPPARVDVLSMSAPFDPDDPTAGKINIPAPTYVDGVLYQGDRAGLLWAKDFFRNLEWKYPKNPVSPINAQAVSSPTVGFVRDSATGTVDQVVYLARRGIPGQVEGQILPFPIRVFNEVLQAVPPPATPGTYKRRTTGPVRDLTWQLHWAAPNGQMNQIALTDASLDPPPAQTFKINVTSLESQGMPKGAPIIADYELDYALSLQDVPPRTTLSVRNRQIQPTEGSGVLSTPALSPKDILYFATENGNLYAMQESGRGSTRPIVKWRWFLGDPAAAVAGGGAGVGTALPTVVGSPVVANDVAYFAVNDANYGYILAFNANPNLFLTVRGDDIDRTKGVTVEQDDYMNLGAKITISGVSSDSSKAQYASFIVDYDSRKLIFNNLRNGPAPDQELSTSNNIVVKYFPASDPNANLPIEELHPQLGDKWNNLLWCVGGMPWPCLSNGVLEPCRQDGIVMPKITSSPIVLGGMLYVGCFDGSVACIPLEEARRRADAAAKCCDDKLPIMPPLAEWFKPVSNQPVLATVAGSHGMLAITTSTSLIVLYNPVTLIADANRLVEIDSSGEVVWSCDSTSGYVTTSAAAAGGPGKPVYGSVKMAFNRPAVARRASIGGIVVADTGNDRIVHIDTGGKILWQITDFADPGLPSDPNYPNAPLLPAGSPLSLSRPMDVSMWMSKQPGQFYPEYHYLIADSGNYRVVEIVARFDPGTNGYRNELDWTSKTVAQGKRYRYVSARRVLELSKTDRKNPAAATVKNWCVISNVGARGKDLTGDDLIEGPGGALVNINQLTGQIDEIKTTLYDPFQGKTYKLLNPSFFSREYRGKNEYSEVIIDASGIYVLEYSGGNLDRIHAPYTAKQYDEDTRFSVNDKGKPLAVSYAQVLPNGNVLVTNKASGTYRDPSGNIQAFMGEIFEMRWSNADGEYVIVWPDPPGRLVEPQKSSHGLRQPSSAERQVY